MPEIIDQYHGDPTLTRLFAALEDRPEAFAAIKTASFESGASLPLGAYAWPDAERYPVHTREDTIASLAYRAKYAGAVPRYVDEVLADAAEAYGIDPSMFAPDLSKTASETPRAPVQYAVPSMERLPLGSAEQVKVAQEVLLRDGLRALPFEECVQSFGKVAAAAGQYGVTLSPEAAAYAAQNGCNTYLLRDRVGMRAARTKVAAAREAYDALDEALSRQPARILDQGALVKLASRLHELDEMAGLTGDYGRKIFDPMKSVFNDPTVKIGGEMIDVAGKAVPLDTLMGLPSTTWEDLDAPEMGKIAESGDAGQFKTVFATLPRDIKMVLAGQLR